MPLSSSRVVRSLVLPGACAVAFGLLAIPTAASADPAPQYTYTIDSVEHSAVTGIQQYRNASAIAYDTDGDLYAAVPDVGQLRERDAATGAWAPVSVPIPSPSAVAVNPADGTLWVADMTNQTLAHRDTSGNWTIVPGPAATNVYGIAVDAAGDVFVLDSFTPRVWEMSANEPGVWADITGNGTWGHLTDIAVSPSGTVYVADGNSSEAGVYRLGADDTWSTITSVGEGAGQVYSPSGLATASNGDLLVTDVNHVIEVLHAASGTWSRFGEQGMADGQFSGVNDVAMFGDEIAVNDAGNTTVTFVHQSLLAAPTVTTSPAPTSTTAGDPVTFTVAGTGDPTVQWQQSTDGGTTWTDIDGATDPTYTVAQPTTAMNGTRYRALLTNAAGTATSDPAILTVTPAASTGTGTGGSSGGSTGTGSTGGTGTGAASGSTGTVAVTAPSSTTGAATVPTTADPVAAGSLAYTGSDSLPGVLAGFGLVLAGIATAVVRGRRRRA
jgi:hypothetical protein